MQEFPEVSILIAHEEALRNVVFTGHYIQERSSKT
jgi:hypothetical protein